MTRSARLTRKVRDLVSLAQRLAGRDGASVAECCYDLLDANGQSEDYLTGASCLNNNSVPLQLCLTSGRTEGGLRIIGDPGAFIESTEARYRASIETLRRVLASRGDADFVSRSNDTIALLLPTTPDARKPYSQGFTWIAAGPTHPSVAFYVEMAPLGQAKGWAVIEAWLLHMLPTVEAATRIIDTLRRHCVVASAGLEGSTASNARAKIYFRLREAMTLDELKIDLLSSKVMQEFLSLAMGSLSVDLGGLVLSIGLSLATGALVDAKIDLCGHCLTHSLSEWSTITRAITDRCSLVPLDLHFAEEGETAEVAFVGLGLTAHRTPRLNLYLRHAARIAVPDPDEIENAVVDATRYLRSRQRADGSWSDFDLPVGASDQWVTAYVSLALARAGKALLDVDATAAARNGATWLSGTRTYRSGWGYSGITGPDSDSTAIAIALFDDLGIPVPDEDRRFLRDHWRGDEGLATYDEPNAWGVGHWDVTPWGYLGLHPDDQAAYRGHFLAALEKNRLRSGFWRTYWWRNPYYCTLATLEVLERLGIPEPESPLDGPAAPICIDNPFDLGCYIGIEFTRNQSGSKIDTHLRELLNWQAGDGSWSGAANLRVTESSCYAPWDTPRGAYYKDQHATFTTATIIRVLARLHAHRSQTSDANAPNRRSAATNCIASARTFDGGASRHHSLRESLAQGETLAQQPTILTNTNGQSIISKCIQRAGLVERPRDPLV